MCSDKVIQRKQPALAKPAGVNPSVAKKKVVDKKNESDAQTGIYGKAQDLLFTQYMRTLIYKDSFSATLLITKLSMGLNFILGFALIAFSLQSPATPPVLGIDTNGRIQTLQPLSGDSLSSKQLTSWAQDCVLRLNSYTFYSVINHLNTVMPECLTDEAARTFRQNFETVVLDELRVNEQSYEASPDGAGIIIAEGVVDNRKAYQLEIPIIVTRYDQNRQTQNFKYTIKLEIIRVSQEQFWKGVKIYNYKEVKA
jgi:hypothetical protein